MYSGSRPVLRGKKMEYSPLVMSNTSHNFSAWSLVISGTTVLRRWKRKKNVNAITASTSNPQRVMRMCERKNTIRFHRDCGSFNQNERMCRKIASAHTLTFRPVNVLLGVHRE